MSSSAIHCYSHGETRRFREISNFQTLFWAFGRKHWRLAFSLAKYLNNAHTCIYIYACTGLICFQDEPQNCDSINKLQRRCTMMKLLFFCASNGNTSSHMESKISQLQMLLNRSLTICRYWTPRHFPAKLLSRHCEIMIWCKATSHYLNPVKWYIYTTTCKSCWYCHYSWGTTLMFPHAETMGHGHPCVKYIKKHVCALIWINLCITEWSRS